LKGLQDVLAFLRECRFGPRIHLRQPVQLLDVKRKTPGACPRR
jgi:hypothetical protein